MRFQTTVSEFSPHPSVAVIPVELIELSWSISTTSQMPCTTVNAQVRCSIIAANRNDCSFTHETDQHVCPHRGSGIRSRGPLRGSVAILIYPVTAMPSHRSSQLFSFLISEKTISPFFIYIKLACSSPFLGWQNLVYGEHTFACSLLS